MFTLWEFAVRAFNCTDSCNYISHILVATIVECIRCWIVSQNYFDSWSNSFNSWSTKSRTKFSQVASELLEVSKFTCSPTKQQSVCYKRLLYLTKSLGSRISSDYGEHFFMSNWLLGMFLGILHSENIRTWYLWIYYNL